jgi:hypothetical protein
VPLLGSGGDPVFLHRRNSRLNIMEQSR